MATEEQTKTLDYVDGYTDEITDELSEDGGAAVAQVPEKEIKYDVVLEDNENNIEFEVETEPAPEPEPEPYEETVTEEVTEECTYNPGYNRRRKAHRRCNKHIFTWIFNFVLGIYGVDRFARGQIGLGLLKMLTSGGFGFWYLADLVVAILLNRMSDLTATRRIWNLISTEVHLLERGKGKCLHWKEQKNSMMLW